MISEGLITRKDIEEAKSGKGSNVITIGLPAYCLLQGLLRSAKVNSMGILISKLNHFFSFSDYFSFNHFEPFFFTFSDYFILTSLNHFCYLLNVDDDTELTLTNRPREKFFEWFLNPLLIIKEQIKADNLSVSEEDYLCKLVLLNDDAERLKESGIGPAPESEVKRAELHAFARRYF